MGMTTYYRIQQANRAVTDLLDPEQQVTYNWNDAADIRHCPDCDGTGADFSDPAVVTDCTRCDGTGEIENVRQGVSVVESIEDLYRYIRISGAWPYDAVIVELDGTVSADEGEDAEIGEVLVHPTDIISVSEVTDEMIDTIYQEN